MTKIALTHFICYLDEPKVLIALWFGLGKQNHCKDMASLLSTMRCSCTYMHCKICDLQAPCLDFSLVCILIVKTVSLIKLIWESLTCFNDPIMSRMENRCIPIDLANFTQTGEVFSGMCNAQQQPLSIIAKNGLRQRGHIKSNIRKVCSENTK